MSFLMFFSGRALFKDPLYHITAAKVSFPVRQYSSGFTWIAFFSRCLNLIVTRKISDLSASMSRKIGVLVAGQIVLT